MHPELARLLELQEKDFALLDVDKRLQALLDERDSLDKERDRSLGAVQDLGARVKAARKQRETLEGRIEGLRAIQESRRGRMEQVKTAREAQALTTELEIARAALAREEGEWLRQAEAVTLLEQQQVEAERAAGALEEEQRVQRDGLAAREAELMAERDRARADRETVAAAVERNHLMRYDRLRGARHTLVVVALHGAACGACYTAVPTSRRSQIRSGLLLDGCEACGVILYSSDDEA